MSGWIFEKNIFVADNFNTRTEGKNSHFQKHQIHGMTIYSHLMFVIFWIFHFLCEIKIICNYGNAQFFNQKSWKFLVLCSWVHSCTNSNERKKERLKEKKKEKKRKKERKKERKKKRKIEKKERNKEKSEHKMKWL